MYKACWCIFLILFFSSPVFAYDYNTKYRVDVDISADNTDLKTSIENYVRRELTALGDVQIQHNNRSFHIQIVVVETKANGENANSIAMSINFINYVFAEALRGLISNKLIGDDEESLITMSQSLCTIDNQYATVCSIEDLEKVCKQIVARFDAEVLEGYRKRLAIKNQK